MTNEEALRATIQQATDRIAEIGGYTDRRARDADRISRWTVMFAVGLAVVMISLIGTLIYQMAELSAAVNRLNP